MAPASAGRYAQLLVEHTALPAAARASDTVAKPMWITLYDVSRDGIGIVPWFFALMWIAGIIGGALFVLTSPIGRLFLALWLTFWLVAGGFGLGYSVFYNFAANVHALKAGSCQIVEGPIANFHPQNIMRKGDSEHFVVAGHEFTYEYDNLGGGGLRSSKSFRVPLKEGLYVKVWYRGGIICRLEASPRLSSSLTQ
jgi:energy-coupling factor transporter transmembrane protein EcfT